MRTIHLGNDTGKKIAVPESEIAGMRAEGKLDAYSLYWVDGMTDWRPVAELPPEMPPVAAAFTSPTVAETVDSSGNWAPPSRYGYYVRKSPKRLTRILVALLAMNLLMHVAGIVVWTLRLQFLGTDFTEEQNAASTGFVGFYTLASISLHLLTVIFFAMWVYRTNNNCHSFGTRGMKFRPGWSVGCFFVPILWYWKPYQAMKEMWKVSLNPLNWMRQQPPVILKIWWGLWILGVILDQCINASIRTAVRVPDLKVTAQVAIARGVNGVFLCAAAIAVVWGLYSTQRRLVRGEANIGIRH